MKKVGANFKRNRREYFKRELKNVIDKIVRGYSPEKIILFGSLSKKSVQYPGDMDLIIVKSTNQDPWERAASVDEIIEHNVPLDILIYTPEEIRKRRAMHDEFVEEFSTKGKVVYDG